MFHNVDVSHESGSSSKYYKNVNTTRNLQKSLHDNCLSQDKVYEELHFVFGDDTTRPPDLEDLKQLVYLEQCIKETLRRFPPVPFVLREAVEDLELKGKFKFITRTFH